MRITPQKLYFRRYEISSQAITLQLGAAAKIETFVEERPANPAVIPMPPPSLRQIAPDIGFRFHVPVIADYSQIEPVLARALHGLEGRPLVLPGVGAVSASFDKVTLYPTTKGRLAIGLAMRVDTPGPFDPRGTVWLTGQPFNAPGSQVVQVRDLTITGSRAGLWRVARRGEIGGCTQWHG